MGVFYVFGKETEKYPTRMRKLERRMRHNEITMFVGGLVALAQMHFFFALILLAPTLVHLAVEAHAKVSRKRIIRRIRADSA